MKNLTFYVFLGLLAYLPARFGTNLDINLFAKAWAQEEEIEGEIEDSLEDDLEDQLEDQLEDELEDQLEDQLEDELEDQLEDQLEDELEDQLEDQLEDELEDQLEDELEDQLEDQLEDELEDQLEDDLEDQLEDDLEDQLEDDLEDQVEDDLQEKLEGDLETELEDDLEDDVEDELDDDIEDEIDDDLDDEIDDDLDDDLEDGLKGEDIDDDDLDDDDLDDDLDDDDEEDDDDDENDDDDLDDDDLEQRAERLPELIRDNQGFLRARDVWVILTDEESLNALRGLNFKISKVSRLKTLDMMLAEVVEPRDMNLSQVRDLVYSVLPKAELVVDFNHVYTYRPETTTTQKAGALPAAHQQPQTLLPLPELPTKSIKIGLIDSQVNDQHESLQHARITSKAFVPPGIEPPLAHGTAIASILSGRSDLYRGLLPEVELYSASVFYQHPDVGESALVTSLILSLDWLAQAGVDVVNMSLTGPGNGLLQTTLEKMNERDIIVVAAVGNNGPVARPLYPAAYDSVVAVTAVTGKNRVYPLANRGLHIAFSAPGVEVQHAAPGSGYTHSSGTSLAVPFVSAGLAWAVAAEKNKGNRHFNPRLLLDRLYKSAQDLGDPGHDSIYGHGLIQPTADD